MANLMPNNARSAGLMSGGILALVLAVGFTLGGIVLFAMQEVLAVALMAVAAAFVWLGVRQLKRT